MEVKSNGFFDSKFNEFISFNLSSCSSILADLSNKVSDGSCCKKDLDKLGSVVSQLILVYNYFYGTSTIDK